MQVSKVKEGDIQTLTQSWIQTVAQGQCPVKTKAGLREASERQGEKPSMGPSHRPHRKLSCLHQDLVASKTRCNFAVLRSPSYRNPGKLVQKPKRDLGVM